MNPYLFATVFCLLYLLRPLPGYTQNTGIEDNSDEPKIMQRQVTLKSQYKAVPTLRWPQKKHDSPFFCDELIPYKDGYIINSIATSPDNRGVETRTSFYYYQPNTQTLSLLMLPGIDTIESILAGKKDQLYCCYKEKGKRMAVLFKDGVKQVLLSPEVNSHPAELDTAAWIKLGYSGEELYALSPGGAFLFSGNQWKQLVASSLKDYYRQVLKYRYTQSCLPTVNITVTQDAIWFLQEVLQLRECRLLKLSLQTGRYSDFFTEQGYTDDYLKQVTGFCVLPDNTLIVAASRLIGNNMILQYGNGQQQVWTFNNAFRVPNGTHDALYASALLPVGDTIYLAGIDGLFMKYKETITPLLRWDNTHQTIRNKDGDIDFEFVPRNILRLSNTRFLIGGLWGGLYLVDIAQPFIRCQDDVPEKKIKDIDLNSLAGTK